MPIDSNIALGYRAPQFESPLAQAAQSTQLANAQQQNILGQMQMAEMGRAAEQKNQMRGILANADPTSPEINNLIRKAYVQSGDIAGLMAHNKMLAEAKSADAKVLESEAKTKQANQATDAGKFELQRKKLDHAFTQIGNAHSADEYIAKIRTSLKEGHFTQEQADGALAEVAQAQKLDAAQGGDKYFQGLRRKALEGILSAKDNLARTEPKPEKVEAGGTIEFRDLNPNSPTYGQTVGPKSITKTATISETETRRSNLEREKVDRSKLGIENAKLKLQKDEAAQKADPAFQQAMAAAKARGEAIAKGDVAAVQALPKILDRADRAINLIDEMVGKQEVRDKFGKVIEKGTAPHPGFNSAVGFGLGERFVPGTSASDFQSRFEEIKGGAFLEAFESLKGAGSISEKEGEKATTAITRMSLAQSEKEFMAAARDLQDVVRTGVKNAKNRASQAPSSATSPPAGFVVDGR